MSGSLGPAADACTLSNAFEVSTLSNTFSSAAFAAETVRVMVHHCFTSATILGEIILELGNFQGSSLAPLLVFALNQGTETLAFIYILNLASHNDSTYLRLLGVPLCILC